MPTPTRPPGRCCTVQPSTTKASTASPISTSEIRRTFTTGMVVAPSARPWPRPRPPLHTGRCCAPSLPRRPYGRNRQPRAKRPSPASTARRVVFIHLFTRQTIVVFRKKLCRTLGCLLWRTLGRPAPVRCKRGSASGCPRGRCGGSVTLLWCQLLAAPLGVQDRLILPVWPDSPAGGPTCPLP